MRADLWEQYVGGDPRSASIEKLNDLYAHLARSRGVKPRVDRQGPHREARAHPALPRRAPALSRDWSGAPCDALDAAERHERQPRPRRSRGVPRTASGTRRRGTSTPRETPDARASMRRGRGADRGGGQGVGRGRRRSSAAGSAPTTQRAMACIASFEPKKETVS